MRQDFRLKNTDETKEFFLKNIEQNELMSKKLNKICTTLNFIEHFLILASTVTGEILISALVSLLGIPIGIRISGIGLKICAISAEIKKNESKIKQKKRSLIKEYC